MRNRYVTLLYLTFRNLNWFEWLLIGAIMALSVTSFIIKGEVTVNSSIAAVSAILGVFCVVLGAKGSMANWIFGIVECFLYMYISFSEHIYGDALQRLFYTLPMQFLGWHWWSQRKRRKNTDQIQTRWMTWKARGSYLVLIAVMTVVFAQFLKYAGPYLAEFFQTLHIRSFRGDYVNEGQLWLDATTTVLAIVTTFISTRAYVEQWYLWLFINIFSISIWWMNDSEFSFMTVSKYSIYLVNTFYGIYMWTKLAKPEETE